MAKQAKALQMPQPKIEKLPLTTITVRVEKGRKVFAIGRRKPLMTDVLRAEEIFGIREDEGVEVYQKGKRIGSIWPAHIGEGPGQSRLVMRLHEEADAMQGITKKMPEGGVNISKIPAKAFHVGDTLALLVPAETLRRRIDRGYRERHHFSRRARLPPILEDRPRF